MEMSDCDVLIVGGGIAGASLGAAIAGKRRTIIVEAESHCGYHATGRSAAFWLESYGGPQVALLSAASHEFLARPPADFSERGFLRTRGALHVTRDELPKLPATVESRLVERDELERLVPGMPADVLIVTGERTLFQYLMSPITDLLFKSMREH